MEYRSVRTRKPVLSAGLADERLLIADSDNRGAFVDPQIEKELGQNLLLSAVRKGF
jgi:hypothetical protein